MKNCTLLGKLIPTAAILLIVITGCKRTEIPTTQILPTVANVFVVGEEFDQTTSKFIAKLWKNAVGTNLGNENTVLENAEVNSVIVVGDKVYITGYANSVNGSPASSCPRPFLYNLPYGINLETMYCTGTIAYSTCSSGTNLYTVGKENDRAVLWKNGINHRLPSPIGSRSAAFSVSTLNTDIYTVGYESINYTAAIAKVWKNDIPTSLTDGITPGLAKSIFISGSDIYIVGTHGGFIKVWKNNILVSSIAGGSLPNIGNCIYVFENDVYICGSGSSPSSNSNLVAKVWKNGISTNLTNGLTNAQASGVFVFENDIYVAGVEQNSAGIAIGKVWKNGVPTSLTDGTKYTSIKSIFVN
jgi:hypothetical protein